MQKFALLLAAAIVMSLTDAAAQNIALGERVPDMKSLKWLNEQRPEAAEITYVEFYQSTNKACKTSLDKLTELGKKLGKDFRVIVVTREKEEVIGDLLTPYLAARFNVAFDPSGKAFSAYGVSYLPFGVLLDGKGRALWLGNSLQLTEEVVEKSK